MYNNGDIIKARVKKYPVVFHYGIILRTGQKVMVVHNTPNGFNQFGGSVFIDDINTWQKKREIVNVMPSMLTVDEINQAYEDNKAEKFSILHNNCEHFVFKTYLNERKSPQLQMLVYMLIISVFLYFIF